MKSIAQKNVSLSDQVNILSTLREVIIEADHTGFSFAAELLDTCYEVIDQQIKCSKTCPKAISPDLTTALRLMILFYINPKHSASQKISIKDLLDEFLEPFQG